MNAMTKPHQAALAIGDLEAVYDALAQAIDLCGPARAQLFLVKLALLNAQSIGVAGVVEEHIRRALEDLQ